MRSQRLVLALFASVILGAGLLAAIGLRSLAIDAERVDARYREQASGALTAVRGALDVVLAEVRRAAAPAIGVRIASDGTLIEPAITVPSASDETPPSGPRDRVLQRYLSDEVDRLEREGQDAAARARLREAAAREDDAWLAAWALSTLAAIEKRAGETAAAIADWRTLASRHAGITDDRGLDRALAARYELALFDSPSEVTASSSAEAAPGTPPVKPVTSVSTLNSAGPTSSPNSGPSTSTVIAMLALYSDMIDASSRADGAALAAQKARVVALLTAELEVESHEPALRGLRPGFAELVERDRRRELASSIAEAFPHAVASWFTEHAGSGARVLELRRGVLDPPSSPPRRALIAWVREPDGTANGGALDLDRCAELALARPEIAAYAALGIATVIASEDGRKLAVAGAGDRDLGDDPLVEQRGAAPFEDLRLAAFGIDRAGFLARERQRFILVAALSLIALAVASVAGFATVRAVKREIDAARGREDFVAAVTHELKAPLASIRLLAEVLGRGGVEEEKVREFAARTVTESERLTRLVDSVLEWARIEHSSAAKRDRIDLNAVAARALDTFRPLARERGFDVELRASKEAVTVLGDADALEGALLNLLDNALKYSDGPHVIEIEVERAVLAVLAVLDRGRGVPIADAQHIFEPFRRVGDELVRDRPGVGLGLALVHKIALAHGGRATYTARNGGGSRFAIELPLTEGVKEPGATRGADGGADLARTEDAT